MVRQFHFTAWPDHGVPQYATSLLSYRRKVRSFDDPSAGPTVIHCSAGVGRTGTFLALDYLLDQAKVEGQLDVFGYVYELRRQRPNMIQTYEQYMFIYDALLEALRSGETAIPAGEFRSAFSAMCKLDPDSNTTPLQVEFEVSVMACQVTYAFLPL